MPVTWPGAPPVRLMGDLGLRGVRRAKSPRTTRNAAREQCPADLVRRHFEAFAPGGLWVADIPPQAGGAPSYVRAFSGRVYAAFVTDVYSQRIIGWQTTYRPVCTDLALDALKMTVWQRKRTGADHLTGLVHHLRPRRAVQVYSLRAGPIRGRGSRLGGFQGRPLPASPWPRHSSSLYKAELIRNQGPLGGHRHRPCSPPPSGSTGRAPSGHTPPSACEPPPSTKPPGHPTPTTRNNHNQQPPQPDKPATTKPEA